jgi:endo-1,4-beta-xylanase
MYRSHQIQALDDKDRNFTAVGETPLSERAAAKGLIYGAAAHTSHFLNAKFAARFVQECKLLVTENELQSKNVRPTLNTFDFRAADSLAQFAQTHGMLFRGHSLVWHILLPDWFKEMVNRQNAEQFLVNHIKTLVGRYARRIHSWDVVNEAIATYEGRPDGLQNTPWLEFLGPDYIDLAFRVAAEADPNALLVYNDYGLEYDTPEAEAKRTTVLKLLERLKSQGTPIHALGIQSHLSGSETRFNHKKQQDFLSKVASLGLKILITEMDVRDKDLPSDPVVRDRIIAGAYEDYLSVVLNEPAVIAVVTWGLSDRYTWISEFFPRSDGALVRPLPLDADLKPKLAWNAIARAFDNAPSRLVQQTINRVRKF